MARDWVSLIRTEYENPQMTPDQVEFEVERQERSRPVIQTKPRELKNAIGFSRYGAGATKSLCLNLLRAAPGNRDNALNYSLYRVGRLIAGDEVPWQFDGERYGGTAIDMLVQAAREIGLKDSEIRTKLRSAVEAGIEKGPIR